MQQEYKPKNKRGAQMADGTNAKAWAWVLEHALLIRSTALKAIRQTPLDYDDVHSALLIKAVERFEEFDGRKGTPQTWMYWLARSVVSRMRKEHNQNTHTVIEIGFHDQGTGHKRMMATAELSIIRPLATQAEWDAIFARFEGLSLKEIEARLGVTPWSANRSAKRLTTKLQRSGHGRE